MTQAAIFEAIRSRFKTQVSDPLSLRTLHDNAPLPEGVTAEWCRFLVGFDEPWRRASTGGPGSRRHRVTGTATAIISVPIAKGDAPAVAIADVIVAEFRDVSIAPMITFTGAGVVGGAEQDAAWCRRRVAITFRADEVS